MMRALKWFTISCVTIVVLIIIGIVGSYFEDKDGTKAMLARIGQSCSKEFGSNESGVNACKSKLVKKAQSEKIKRAAKGSDL